MNSNVWTYTWGELSDLRESISSCPPEVWGVRGVTAQGGGVPCLALRSLLAAAVGNDFINHTTSTSYCPGGAILVIW